MPKGPEAKTEARGYEAETQTKILALRPVWPRGINISGVQCQLEHCRDVQLAHGRKLYEQQLETGISSLR